MRTYILRPAAMGRYPGIVLFSEIFQVTGPVRPAAAQLAGSSFVLPSRKSTMSGNRREPCFPTTLPGRSAVMHIR